MMATWQTCKLDWTNSTEQWGRTQHYDSDRILTTFPPPPHYQCKKRKENVFEAAMELPKSVSL